MRVKNFSQFISEGDWFDNHPDHPANQEDIESQRDIDLKSSQVIFILLASDYTSVAILQHKESKFYYAANLEDTDVLNEYRLYFEIDDEKEYEDIDDDAILFMASDLATLRGAKADTFIGEGIEGWEDGKIVVLIDEPLREYLEEGHTKIPVNIKPEQKKNYENLHKTIVEIKEPLHNMRGKMAGKKYGF
jgi:hypothetical protein